MQLNVYDANNYFRMYLETDNTGLPVSKLFREIQRTPTETHMNIIVWDGPNALAARKAIYPEYKSGRKPASPEKYEALNQLREVLELSSALSIRVPNYEADDVIAHVVNRYKNEFKILIHSNDADLAALGVPMTRDTFKIEPRWVKLYKVLVGDPSDKIPGLPRFGESAWSKLMNPDQREVLELHISDLNIEFTREQIFEAYPISSACDQLMDPKIRERLNTYWKVVSFLDIPDEVIDQHTIVGANNPDAAEAIFKEYML